MMHLRFLPILLLGLATSSCEKIKSTVSSVRSAVESKMAESSAGTTEKADKDLQELVDQTDEGAIFRKDLPFPAHLEVTTTRREESRGRKVESSALGSGASKTNAIRTSVEIFEREDDQVRYTLVESAEEDPAATPPPAATDKSAEAADLTPETKPTAPPMSFQLIRGVWRASRGQPFKTMAVTRNIYSVFDALLVEVALSPRPLWFTEKRLKPGDQLTISGKSLPMLLAGSSTGSLTLTLDSFEPVKGHPCGVFRVTGNYSRRLIPDFEGKFTDADVTIESGKLWLSLLYPLVLREELETIQTLRTSGGGPSVRQQGAVKTSVIRDWEPVTQ